MRSSEPSPDPRQLAAIMSTLSDPTRRGLYEQIVSEGEMTVVELTRSTSVSQPAVSQHLKALRVAGLVVERRQGRNAFYRSEPQALEPLVDWLDHYAVFWRDRFTALRALLKEIDPK